MKDYWTHIPRTAGYSPGEKAYDPVADAIARGDKLSAAFIENRDALFPPMRKLAEAGEDTLKVGVRSSIIEVLADHNSRRGRQHRPDLPLYHPLWEIMLLGGSHGMVACAYGVELAVMQERAR